MISHFVLLAHKCNSWKYHTVKSPFSEKVILHYTQHMLHTFPFNVKYGMLGLYNTSKELFAMCMISCKWKNTNVFLCILGTNQHNLKSSQWILLWPAKILILIEYCINGRESQQAKSRKLLQLSYISTWTSSDCKSTGMFRVKVWNHLTSAHSTLPKLTLCLYSAVAYKH